MTLEQAQVTTSCPECSNTIQIANAWTPGGINDYGGYVLQCNKCQHVFAFRLGRDINDSRVTSGAKVLDQWDDEMGDHNTVVTKHNL